MDTKICNKNNFYCVAFGRFDATSNIFKWNPILPERWYLYTNKSIFQNIFDVVLDIVTTSSLDALISHFIWLLYNLGASASVGTCLPHHGQHEGSTCHRTSDCDFGLVCAISEAGKTCQQPTESIKQYSKPTYWETSKLRLWRVLTAFSFVFRWRLCSE